MQKMRPLGRAFCVVFTCGLWRASTEHNRKVAPPFLCPTLPNTTARRVGFMRRIFSVLLFCACFCASAALKDLANYGVIPSPQEVEEKELDKKRQDELDKIDWLSGAENVEANEILFSKK